MQILTPNSIHEEPNFAFKTYDHMESSNEQAKETLTRCFTFEKELEARQVLIEQLENNLIEVTAQRDEYKNLYDALWDQKDKILSGSKDLTILKTRLRN